MGKTGGETKGSQPIQVRADCLRHLEDTVYGRMGMEPIVPRGNDDEAAAPLLSSPEDKVRWRTASLLQAITAAEKSGLSAYRIAIAPDGTITIIVGEQAHGDIGAA